MTLILAVSLAFSFAPDAELQARLDHLVSEMESSRVSYNVPGMTLGVVKDGEIVLVKAFGERDLASGEPMTVDTPLPIGSSTKAFTATTIGMLADEGQMGWDDPVVRHLPNLDLQVRSENPEDQATIRDLLSHQTGFPRMGVLWAGRPATAEEIFTAASRAVPQADLRETFLYNNVMYLAAGEASAAVAGQSWEDLVQARLLDPLDMTSTIMIVDTPEELGQVGLGYRWDDDLQDYKFQEFRIIDSCSPAGSICSTPGDMARWVQFQLADGMVGDKRLISEEMLDETRRSHVRMTADLGYGLGWMIEDWKGHEVVQHGGNIDGYSAMVAMIPEKNVGFVLLMNSMPTAMQEACRGMVWRSLLLDLEVEEGRTVEDLDKHVGSYVANFGPFSDAIMEVTASDGTLFVDVPGQVNYELVPPAEGGEKWPFKMTDAIAVSFHADEQGDINLMKMYQGGMTFQMPRKGTALPPGPFKRSDVGHLLGRYRQDHPLTKGRVDEVRLENGWLVIDIPDQMAFKLSPPNDMGRYPFRDLEGLEVSFSETADGSQAQLFIYQGGQEFPALRIAFAPAEDEDAGPSLPTIDEILAMESHRGGDRLAPGEALEISGDMLIPSSGVEGTFALLTTGPGQFRSASAFGPFGDSVVAINGQYGAEVSDFYPHRRFENTELELARLGNAIVGYWPEVFDTLEVTGESEVDGLKTIKIEAMAEGVDQPFTLHVDPATGNLRKADVWTFVPNLGPYPMEMFVDEPVAFGDVLMPSSWALYSEEAGEIRFNVKSVKLMTGVEDSAFVLPEFPMMDAGS